MSSAVSRESDFAKPSAYCRKEKSLGVLCSNFLRLYDREDAKTIGLDDAATQLGVERRRMYDVVNILEIVGVVARKAKNQYSWNGLGAIPKALEKLREEGYKENFSASICFSTRVSNDDEYKTLIGLNLRGSTDESSSGSTKNRNKRDKSLALLTQNFIKLFLCSEVDFILLENAAKALPGDAEDSTALRTKVRRLYDIANVLSSMNLIEKIRHPDSGKPAYRWLSLGRKSKTETDSGSASDANLPRQQRGFGTDITNYNFKRKRDITFTGEESSGQITKALAEAAEHECREAREVKPQTVKPSSSSAAMTTTSVQFGPFGPVSLSRAEEDRGNKRARHVQDLESLASSYRPQYRNQALCDLFAHYMEAWKSWFVDAIGSQQMPQAQHLLS